MTAPVSVRAAVGEGLHFIVSHPLLPGLYALDWGMTAVSYYRELFPLFVVRCSICTARACWAVGWVRYHNITYGTMAKSCGRRSYSSTAGWAYLHGVQCRH